MSSTQSKPVPYGAYHKTRMLAYDPELAETGPGTPMGEYMFNQVHDGFGRSSCSG